MTQHNIPKMKNVLKAHMTCIAFVNINQMSVVTTDVMCSVNWLLFLSFTRSLYLVFICVSFICVHP